jgi:hypothetical protein
MVRPPRLFQQADIFLQGPSLHGRRIAKRQITKAVLEIQVGERTWGGVQGDRILSGSTYHGPQVALIKTT